MYLEMIRPFVMFDTTAMREGKPVLEVRAWLRCPHCFNIAEYISPQAALRPEGWKDGDRKTDNEIEGFRYQALQNLKQHRACAECGILSGWPKRDHDKGKQALARLITLEWLRQRIEAMGSFVSIKTYMEASAKMRTQASHEPTRPPELEPPKT